MSALHLFVPGLCGPLPTINDLQNNAVISALIKRLCRADTISNGCSGFYHEMGACLNLDNTPTVPSAAISLHGEGHEVGENYWFHADPVNLQADIDHAFLRDSDSLDITDEDAATLAAEINAHFSADGIEIIVADSGRWYLSFNQHNKVETTPLHSVIGRNVNFFLPTGKDASFWKQFMNEVQMLMHMSPVNQSREAQGLLPVNSLWLWGEGSLPMPDTALIDKVFSNNLLANGMAKLNDVPLNIFNDDVATVLELIGVDDETLFVIDDLFNVTNYGDISVWQQSLEDVYTKWLDPIISFALKQKLTVKLYPCNGKIYHISSGNKYRLLRRGHIHQHIGSYEQQ